MTTDEPAPDRRQVWRERAARVRPWAAGMLGGTLLITAYYLFPLRPFTKDRPVLDLVVLVTVLILLTAFVIAQVIAVSEGVPRAISFGLPVALCLVIVVFASIYAVLAQVHHEFDGLADKTDSLYFTVTTLSTVGYGDIHPSGRDAKIIVMVQIVFDLVLVASAVGSLKEATARRRRQRGAAHAVPGAATGFPDAAGPGGPAHPTGRP